MTPCQRNVWREEWAVQPLSLDHRLQKLYILLQTRPCQPSGAIEKPCLAPGCLSAHDCHRDLGDARMTSSVAAAGCPRHSPFHVCLITSWSNLSVRPLMNSRQKRELYTAETGQKTLNLRITVESFRFEFVLFLTRLNSVSLHDCFSLVLFSLYNRHYSNTDKWS